jgi:CxxC-x17-CxxC domain-containing protein
MLYMVVFPSPTPGSGFLSRVPRSMTEGCQSLPGGCRVAYTDRTLTCAECGTNFTFSADDQAYHAEKGFTNEPKRCPDCRAARRGQQSQSGGYNSGGYGGQREMFSATCASCGKEARVPFQPRGDKPVYCSDCFRSQQGGGSYSRGSGRSGGGSSSHGGHRW